MKTYNKKKLHKYAKELFALCLDKGMIFEYYSGDKEFVIYIEHRTYVSFHDEAGFIADLNTGFKTYLPIWELIEKVKNIK